MDRLNVIPRCVFPAHSLIIPSLAPLRRSVGHSCVFTHSFTHSFIHSFINCAVTKWSCGCWRTSRENATVPLNTCLQVARPFRERLKAPPTPPRHRTPHHTHYDNHHKCWPAAVLGGRLIRAAIVHSSSTSAHSHSRNRSSWGNSSMQLVTIPRRCTSRRRRLRRRHRHRRSSRSFLSSRSSRRR